MDRSSFTIAAAIGSVFGRPIIVVNRESGDIPGALLHHLCDLRVADVQTVLDRVTAAVERPLQSDTVVCVAGYFLAPSMSLVDDRLQLLDGERRLRDQIAVVVDPGAMSHVDLDP